MDGEELYGSHDEWRNEIARTFEALRVCSAVLLDGEERADIDVNVRLRASEEPAEPDVDTQGAFLDFMAWSTVPGVPLWIPDVHVDPGLVAQLTLKWAGKTDPVLRDVRPSPIKTTQLDRHEFLSWSMAGALFVPPFVFSDPDRERLRETIAARVRLETACAIASAVKGEDLKEEELLRDMEIKRVGNAWYHFYTQSEDLSWLNRRLEPIPGSEGGGQAKATDGIRTDVPNTLRKVKRLKSNLGKLLDRSPRTECLLRIEAHSRTSGRWLGYSIPLPAEALQGPEA